MSQYSSNHYGLTRILRESFDELDVFESTRLVGVLYEFQVLLLNATMVLPALEPAEAAGLVADLYCHNPWRLLRRFHHNWSTLKRAPATRAMIESIKTHDWVDGMAPFRTLNSAPGLPITRDDDGSGCRSWGG